MLQWHGPCSTRDAAPGNVAGGRYLTNNTIDSFCGRFLSCACINTKAIAFCMQAKAGSASMAVMLRHLLLLCRHQKNQPGCRLP